ncbi:hypothetical protein QVD99_001338 [Batrachochytrium dendrobatidis]|nr:hypothetical protein QVD99_001338 [Batrachochytrium dendrobatidis]
MKFATSAFVFTLVGSVVTSSPSTLQTRSVQLGETTNNHLERRGYGRRRFHGGHGGFGGGGFGGFGGGFGGGFRHRSRY